MLLTIFRLRTTTTSAYKQAQIIDGWKILCSLDHWIICIIHNSHERALFHMKRQSWNNNMTQLGLCFFLSVFLKKWIGLIRTTAAYVETI